MALTTKEQIVWLKWIPKSWKPVIAIIMIFGIPASPMLLRITDTYIDNRFDVKAVPTIQRLNQLTKTTDSVLVSNVEKDKQIESLIQTTKNLSDHVQKLNDFLIKSNIKRNR